MFKNSFKKLNFALFSLYLLFCPCLLLAQSAEEAMPPREQNIWQTVIMIALVGAFFYFILWRPEQQRRKALEQKRAEIKKGDRVIAMGIIGTVVRIEEEILILRLYEGAKVEVLKAAVTDIMEAAKEEGAVSEKQLEKQ